MKILFSIIFFVFSLLSKSINANSLNPHIICSNNNKSILLEFILKNKDDFFYDVVFKKVKNKFIKVGNVVGQKFNSFIMFEDKYAFLGIDFAWHLDKNTMKLSPVLLSEGTIKLKKLPQKLYCINKK